MIKELPYAFTIDITPPNKDQQRNKLEKQLCSTL